jgi:transglutaminase-like putative cysteine protease/lipoprotein NlpI
MVPGLRGSKSRSSTVIGVSLLRAARTPCPDPLSLRKGLLATTAQDVVGCSEGRLVMFQLGWVWGRALGAAIVALGAVAASAADAPGAGPPMREAKVEADSFVRGAPLPPWVQRQAVPPTHRKEPVVLRLRDTQVRIDETVTVFVDRAIQVNESTALGEIGQITLDYIPQHQRLRLHSVQLLRGDTVLDRTASADVRFLERETGFERGVYSGTVTVALVIPDVRVGDTLRIAHSWEGGNPVFGGLYFGDFGWDGPVPTEWRRVTLSHPESRPMRWRMLGDYRVSNVEPMVQTAEGRLTLRFEERAIEPLADEPMVPSDYLKWRKLQVSEFGDWNQVARWAASLFPPVATLPPELEALLTKLSALPTTSERVVAATRWVQGEIRNFSVSLGESSHRPHAPAFVLERRYGDCKDKTYLLLALLRRLGVEATPMLVSMQAPRAPAKVLPSPWPFDHVVIQARVEGKTVYLEPTGPTQTADLAVIAQPPPWFQGLPASEQTAAPIVVGDTVVREPATLDIEERFSLAQLGAEGTLEVRTMMNQGIAELIRMVWPLLPPEQRRQVALDDYEKRWPGIRLVGEPQPIDDLANNRFGYSARFTIPKLVQPHLDGWLMRYSATALRGLINMPPGLQRKFPLRATDFPMERRHLLTVQWPAQISATEDPSVQTMDGKLFRAESRTSFRGSRYEFRLRLSTKASDLAAADVPMLQQDLKRLDDMIPGRVVVEKAMIRSTTTPGPGSAAEAMRRKMQERIDLATGAIRSGLRQGDDLARTYCRRATALASIERMADALADATEAIRLAPELAAAWACHGEVLYFSGDFAAADASLTKALALSGSAQAGTHYIRGMARFYLDRQADAAADFAQAALPDEDGDAELFARLWQVWSLQRARLPLPADALAAARQDPHGAWPRPALSMLVGDMTPEALLAGLDRLQGDEQTLALAEAWFYIGQRHLAEGRIEAARQAFEKCRAQGITSYYEHVAAGFELLRIGRR